MSAAVKALSSEGALPWYGNGDELFRFASVLEAAGAFLGTRDLLLFFEKSWKWTDEYNRWVSFGRPLELDDSSDLDEPSDEREAKRIARKYGFVEPDGGAEVPW